MNKTLKWIIPVILILIGVSCKKSNTTEPPAPKPDTTVPTINVVDPTPGKTFVLGTPLHLQLDLSDNVELKSYQVVITKSLKGVQTSDWAYNFTWTIPAGKKTQVVNHSEITVPLTVTANQTTTGNYDMTVTCLDAAGNKTNASLMIVLSK